MSSSFRHALSRQEETPKRNYSAYTQQRKPGTSLVSMRSPIGSRTSSVLPAKPRTPSYLRQFSLFRSHLNKRDQSDGWVDEDEVFQKGHQQQQQGKREPPEAPRKFGGLAESPRRSSMNVARRLFPNAGVEEQKQNMLISSSANVLASKIAYLRESLKLKNVENEQLKREVARTKKTQSTSVDVDRIKMECVQLRQENERLKENRPASNSPDLIVEIDRREHYIRSLDQQFKTVLGTLKAKHSAELTAKSQTITMLNEKVRNLEAEKIKLEASVDAMIDRHAKEADQMLGKMRNLMEERNRLIIANADQGRMIERLRDEQENNRYTYQTNQSQTNQNNQEKQFKMGQLRDHNTSYQSYDRRY